MPLLSIHNFYTLFIDDLLFFGKECDTVDKGKGVMCMLKYKIVYSSRTGNTGRLAAAIYQGLAERSKDIEEVTGVTRTDEAEVYLVGFWTDCGTCSAEIRDFLKKLSAKKVLLFGTCGFGPSPEYYKKIEEQVRNLIPSDCEYLGCYICQGKMPIAVREKYQKMLADRKKKLLAENMIRNFDRALLHPDQSDCLQAISFVKQCVNE